MKKFIMHVWESEPAVCRLKGSWSSEVGHWCSRRRRFASSYRVEERLARGEQGVEYPLNVLKLFWSRSDIMHVAIAWDNKLFLLLTTAGHVWAGRAHFYLHDHELSRSPPDESFIDMLKQNCCLSGPHFPPPALVEVLQDYVTNYHKVRRLHLIVVDLWRPWKYNTARAREITDQLWLIRDCDNTRRVSPFRPDGPEPPLRCRRFAYGYASLGSPCVSVRLRVLGGWVGSRLERCVLWETSLQILWKPFGGSFCFHEILETSFYCFCKFSVTSVETWNDVDLHSVIHLWSFWRSDILESVNFNFFL